MRTLLLVITALAIALALFVVRPWSEYSPLEMLGLFDPETRIANFRKMETIIPARRVAAGNAPLILPREERPLELDYTFKNKTISLTEFLNRVDGTGLLVIQDGTIIHERYLNGATQTSRFTSWSVAKSFVATLIGIAHDEGKIRSLDDLVTDYVPALKGSAYDGVPIKHVLQMSSGVAFDETYDDRLSDIQLFFWKTRTLGRAINSVLKDYDSAEPSGINFHYASIDTQVLGAILIQLYDTSLSDLLSEKLWQPLGMEADALWNVDSERDDATEIAFCCLNATLRDFSKLGLLYLNQGNWQGKQLVSSAWVRESTVPDAPHLLPGGSPRYYGPRGYQYQWWAPQNANREYMAMGVWGQYIYVSEPDNLVIVRTSVDPDYWENVTETITVFRAIRDSLRKTKR